MNKQTNFAGHWLILAAITFWLSWFLMPDPGTTDTQHILAIVKQSRQNVLVSVTVQIISSILFIISLLSFARYNLIQRKIGWIGIVFLGIGTLGLCADAFFHLLAYYMTDASVTIQADVVKVMEFMQGDALVFLVPILLPLFIGALFLSIGLTRQGFISKIAALLCITGFTMLFVGNMIPNLLHLNKIPNLILYVFTLFAAAFALIGFEITLSTQVKGSVAYAKIRREEMEK